MKNVVKCTCPACQNNLSGLVKDYMIKAGTFVVECNSCGVVPAFRISAVHDEEDAVATYQAVYVGLVGFEIRSDIAIKSYIKWVIRVGKERRLQEGFNQADFITGAMAAFFAAGIPERIPSKWVYGTMQGEDIFADEG